MRAIWPLFFLVAIPNAMCQNYHCNCACKQKVAVQCRPALKDSSCVSICTQQVCGAQTLKDAGDPMSGSCPVTSSTHPPTRGALDIHVLHTIRHQSANLWSGDGDEIVDIKEARKRLLSAAGDDKTHPEDQAQALLEIRSASDEELRESIMNSIEECKSTYGREIQVHFEAVWKGEGGRRWPDMWADKSQHSVAGIRKLFSEAEAGNANVVNLLNCYSGSGVMGLTANVTEPPPKVKADVQNKYHPTYPRNAGADHGGPGHD